MLHSALKGSAIIAALCVASAGIALMASPSPARANCYELIGCTNKDYFKAAELKQLSCQRLSRPWMCQRGHRRPHRLQLGCIAQQVAHDDVPARRYGVIQGPVEALQDAAACQLWQQPVDRLLQPQLALFHQHHRGRSVPRQCLPAVLLLLFSVHNRRIGGR